MPSDTTASKANTRYDPATQRLLSFQDHFSAFLDGTDTPRDYLERCLEVIHQREPTVQAWVCLNTDAARAAADRASERFAAGQPRSPIDGMPIGIKDLFQTKDMPTQMGSPIFKGQQTGVDSASVQALRQAGAVILGKTVTTELGFSHPGPTTNPFDSMRTPGGSSSGSAAAIGAAMVPAALGSQVVGSIIRPAGFCGNIAIKPTLGALNRGERMGLSHSHLGVHAGSLADTWAVAYQIANRAGGDPGYPGLYGPETVAAPSKPQRLIALETEGWAMLDSNTREAYEQVLEGLREQDIELMTRADNPLIEAFERVIGESLILCRDICGWELRWSLRAYAEKGENLLSDSMKQRLNQADGMSADDYRACLGKRERMRAALKDLDGLADGLITLSSVGPAPFLEDPKLTGEPTLAPKTGVAAFNAATSALGAPAITMPLLAVGGLPVGVQVIGQAHQDHALSGLASWVLSNAPRISVEN